DSWGGSCTVGAHYVGLSRLLCTATFNYASRHSIAWTFEIENLSPTGVGIITTSQKRPLDVTVMSHIEDHCWNGGDNNEQHSPGPQHFRPDDKRKHEQDLRSARSVRGASTR